MCSMINERAAIAGGGKGPQGWFAVDYVSVGYDHPTFVRREHAITIMTYSSIAGVCVLTAMVPLVWTAPSWQDIMFGVLVGVASTMGQWIVVLAFRYADASVLAPFSYTQLLWVSTLGYFVFGEVPDLWTIVGAAFIVSSGLYTAHRERVRRSQLLQVAGESSPNP